MGIAFGAEEAADFGGLHIFLYVVVVETYFNECDLNYKAVALLFDVVASYKLQTRLARIQDQGP